VEGSWKDTHGDYRRAHMASGGTIHEVTRLPDEAPPGSSGIQIRFETDLIIEGIRPRRIVRVRPTSWPLVNLSREEYLRDSIEERFPSPAIFPKY